MSFHLYFTAISAMRDRNQILKAWETFTTAKDTSFMDINQLKSSIHAFPDTPSPCQPLICVKTRLRKVKGEDFSLF